MKLIPINSENRQQINEFIKEHWLSTEMVVQGATNDNIDAIRFYQKRGFDMARLYRNALEVSRSLKPSIPVIGDYGIPLRHEIEFEMIL